MSSALIRGTIEDRSPRNAIENFRKEETMAERKDTLTTVFAGGPSNANRELYADPEVFKKFVICILRTLCAVHEIKLTILLKGVQQSQPGKRRLTQRSGEIFSKVLEEER